MSEFVHDSKSPKPTRIAVLPVTNETADAEAPIVLRILGQAEISDKGYSLVDFTQIDEALREKGIKEDGHIDARRKVLERWADLGLA